MTTLILFILVLWIVCCNLIAELKRDLMMMQQNSYRTERYMRWLRTSGDTTSVVRLVGMCVFLIALVVFADPRWAMGIMAAFAGGSFISLISK